MVLQVDAHVSTVAQVIQLSVAPVFLFSGVGTMLVVLTNRLARIVDRTRALEGRPDGATENAAFLLELDTLHRRAYLIDWAVSLSTLAALLICCVVGVLFVGSFLNAAVTRPVAVCFVAAMAALIGALVFFLREILLATSGLRPRRR
ncbi:MAG TPA: DUF2721 domain-containing protein [Gemmatimonadales bacterium]|nr:DUF2721 domain-containing protein [Gemmatimonadales bacterium]